MPEPDHRGETTPTANTPDEATGKTEAARTGANAAGAAAWYAVLSLPVTCTAMWLAMTADVPEGRMMTGWSMTKSALACTAIYTTVLAFEKVLQCDKTPENVRKTLLLCAGTVSAALGGVVKVI